MDNDKVLFELDNVMHSHGCEVHNASEFDPETDVVNVAKAYTTPSGVVWKVAPSKTLKDVWNISLYMPRHRASCEAVSREDFPRDVSKLPVHEKTTTKAVASILSEMRQMAEDLAIRST